MAVNNYFGKILTPFSKLKHSTCFTYLLQKKKSFQKFYHFLGTKIGPVVGNLGLIFSKRLPHFFKNWGKFSKK